MKIVRNLTGLRYDRNSVVTVGTFDGLHIAHREILREVSQRARMREGRSVVLTFDPHPKLVVGDGRPVWLLSTLEERIKLFGDVGIDLLFLIDFTFEFSRQRPRDFYTKYVVEAVGVSEVVVGYDHMFGRDREAGIQELVSLGREFDFSVFAVHPLTIGGAVVSSTEIRTALHEGRVESARAMLGYPYSIAGRVVHGDGRGASLGYPTANVVPESDRKLVPGNGVYVVGVMVGDRQHFGMLNIGTRPTVKTEGTRAIEVHIFDFDETIYDEGIVLTFLKRLRDEQRFSSLAALKEQLDRDREISLRWKVELSREL